LANVGSYKLTATPGSGSKPPHLLELGDAKTQGNGTHLFLSYFQTWINCGYNSDASTLKDSPFNVKLSLPYETDVKHLQGRAPIML
jgi:hypothetical protein